MKTTSPTGETTIRSIMVALLAATAIGGISGCGAQASHVATSAAKYAKEVGACVAEKIAECAAQPLRVWCPDCDHYIENIRR
jgi:hypothetical protein